MTRSQMNQTESTTEKKKETDRYTRHTKIRDVINDPVFGDYGRLIFPVDMQIDSSLGLHWNLFLRLFDRKLNISARKKKYGFRILAGVIALYGCYAFIKRQIGSYMFLRMHFVFFDYMEPLIFFMADYIAVMGLFIAVGYYSGKLLKTER